MSEIKEAILVEMYADCSIRVSRSFVKFPLPEKWFSQKRTSWTACYDPTLKNNTYIDIRSTACVWAYATTTLVQSEYPIILSTVFLLLSYIAVFLVVSFVVSIEDNKVVCCFIVTVLSHSTLIMQLFPPQLRSIIFNMREWLTLGKCSRTHNITFYGKVRSFVLVF